MPRSERGRKSTSESSSGRRRHQSSISTNDNPLVFQEAHSDTVKSREQLQQYQLQQALQHQQQQMVDDQIRRHSKRGGGSSVNNVSSSSNAIYDLDDSYMRTSRPPSRLSAHSSGTSASTYNSSRPLLNNHVVDGDGNEIDLHVQSDLSGDTGRYNAPATVTDQQHPQIESQHEYSNYEAYNQQQKNQGMYYPHSSAAAAVPPPINTGVVNAGVRRSFPMSPREWNSQTPDSMAAAAMKDQYTVMPNDSTTPLSQNVGPQSPPYQPPGISPLTESSIPAIPPSDSYKSAISATMDGIDKYQLINEDNVPPIQNKTNKTKTKRKDEKRRQKQSRSERELNYKNVRETRPERPQRSSRHGRGRSRHKTRAYEYSDSEVDARSKDSYLGGRGLKCSSGESGAFGSFETSILDTLGENDVFYVKQKYAYFSIILSILQLLVMMLMMALCGVAPLDVNPMVGPYPDTLSYWGGKNTYLITNDYEFWRFFSPIMLHAGVIHLFCNVAVQLETGAFFEREWGSVIWVVVYFTSTVGSIVTSCLSRPNSISVGSSGALMGLFGAKLSEVFCISCFTMSKRGVYRGHNIHMEQLGGVLCSVAIVSLFSFIPFVDWAGHMGGLFTGFSVGMVIFSIQIESKQYRFLWGALGVILIGLYMSYSFYFLFTEIQPDNELADVCEYYRQIFHEGYDCACQVQ